MHLSLSQQMKMSQQMKLAPRMIQSMEILQLPIMALKERIEQELSENEMFEDAAAVDAEPVVTAETEGSPPEDIVSSKPLDQQELVVDTDHNNAADFERLSEMAPSEWPDDDDTYKPRVSAGAMDEEGDRKLDAMANMQSRPVSLQDYLLEQFRFFSCTAPVRQFAEYLIQNLDHNGRLPAGLPEMMEMYGLPITADDAQTALSLIQKCDPPGVGARDLKECFLLQLRPETPYRDVLTTLISAHLEDLAENRLPVIQRKTGYSIDAIKAAWQELLKFDPRPGREYESNPTPNVVPDVYVEQDATGKWVIRLEDEYTPRLHISRKYQQLLAAGGADATTRDYIKRKIESAKWLIESIEQRYSTLRRVAQAIVDHQSEYLERGPEFIVPLKMQQIADVVGVHVTTVSRAVDDKWIQTPRGIVPLKRFFGGGTTTSDGEEVAWDIIRGKLKAAIDGEDKNDPLSDDALVELLKQQGYNLARRTITKYRKLMKIPSSRQRKAY